MGVLLLSSPGASVQLSLTLEDLDATKFPQATVYDSSDSLVATVDLPHVVNGRYSASYTTPGTADKFSVQYIVYSDSGHTALDTDYGADQDSLITDIYDSVWSTARTAGGAGSFGEAVRTVLGVAGKSNMRIDLMVYDVNGFLTSARIRLFPNSATASASTSGGTGEGEILTMNLSGTPDALFSVLPTTVLSTGP